MTKRNSVIQELDILYSGFCHLYYCELDTMPLHKLNMHFDKWEVWIRTLETFLDKGVVSYLNNNEKEKLNVMIEGSKLKVDDDYHTVIGTKAKGK